MYKIGITERGDASVDFGKLTQMDESLPGEDYDGIILITKDPAGLYNKLKFKYVAEELDISKLVVHCTITGWGMSALEPRVPFTYNSFGGYLSLVDWLGTERVVLRVDPIIPTEDGIRKAVELVRASKSRVRISFLDMYKHVRARMEKECPNLLSEILSAYPDGGLHCDIRLRQQIYYALGKFTSRRIEVCGEPGMACTGCVSAKDLTLFGIEPETAATSGQRRACACLANKTEMLSRKGQCKHGCLYCYWR